MKFYQRLQIASIRFLDGRLKSGNVIQRSFAWQRVPGFHQSPQSFRFELRSSDEVRRIIFSITGASRACPSSAEVPWTSRTSSCALDRARCLRNSSGLITGPTVNSMPNALASAVTFIKLAVELCPDRIRFTVGNERPLRRARAERLIPSVRRCCSSWSIGVIATIPKRCSPTGSACRSTTLRNLYHI